MFNITKHWGLRPLVATKLKELKKEDLLYNDNSDADKRGSRLGGGLRNNLVIILVIIFFLTLAIALIAPIEPTAPI